MLKHALIALTVVLSLMLGAKIANAQYLTVDQCGALWRNGFDCNCVEKLIPLLREGKLSDNEFLNSVKQDCRLATPPSQLGGWLQNFIQGMARAAMESDRQRQQQRRGHDCCPVCGQEGFPVGGIQMPSIGRPTKYQCINGHVWESMW